jgi:hypothetical protein
MKGFIKSGQVSLFGHDDVIGFGDPDGVCVRVMPRDEANAIIKAGHYSQSVVRTSVVHLAVIVAGRVAGALQFGSALNPASGGGIVRDCARDEWLELNRMWVDDEAPRCTESAALSCAIKYLRKTRPSLTWVQSFADERAGGRLGVVYQACSALYLGEHLTEFVEFEGRAYHKMAWTASDDWLVNSGKSGSNWLDVKRAVESGEVTPQAFRQFRYFFPVRRPVLRRLLLEPQPYPKPEAVTP